MTRAFLFFLLLSIIPAMAHAERAANTEVDLLLESSSVRPGQTVWAAVRFRPDPEWHVYWMNAGDSGLPPSLAWTLSQGTEAGAIEWPAPSRITVGGLTSYGYEHEAVLLVPLSIGPQVAEGEQPVKLRVDFLACKVDCLPGTVNLNASVAISEEHQPAARETAVVFERGRERLPSSGKEVRSEAVFAGNTLEITFTGPFAAVPQDLYFFPEEPELIRHSGVQSFDGRTLSLPLAPSADRSLNELKGVLSAANPVFNNNRAVELTIPIVGGTPTLNFWYACLLAFLGGILLNLMPCVLPVLSLKILSLVKATRNPSKLLESGMLYTLGVMVTFLLVAGLMLILRGLGNQLGWGFQFQSVHFVLAMIILLTIFTMNLLEVFEVAPPQIAGQERLGRWGSFGTGVLATLLATPCTAPLMGPALGLAVTLPVGLALAIFAALGFGMAFPFLVLTLFPRALTFIPKPGKWMIGLKAVFAMMLAATATWLVWVLSAQTGSCGAKAALIAVMLAVASAIVFGRYQQAGGRWKLWLAAGLLIGALAGGVWKLAACPSFDGDLLVEKASFWKRYSDEALSRAQSRGETVFINFTAKWCLTCQANAATVFQDERVVKALSRPGVVALEADWTRFDSEITAALSRYGYSSVPLYVVYPAGREDPEVLPVVLTPEAVVEALNP